MVKTALFVRLEAKPGKKQEVESFLMGGLPLVEQEPATIAWFGLKIAPSVYGIFDAFPDDAGRQAHLSGKVAEALMARAPDLFASSPEIMNIDVTRGEAAVLATSASGARLVTVAEIGPPGRRQTAKACA
jgi:quinol monooxygenase YgiN